MTDTKTVQGESQADANAPEYLGDYATAAADVADVIGSRDGTHGDPETFATTFAGMLNVYLLPVLSRAGRLGAADAFVVLDLMKSARIAVGGPHPDHFTDKAGYGLLGLVHTQRAFAAVEAFQAQEKARQEAAARAPKAPEPAAAPAPLVLAEGGLYPPTGTPGQDVMSVDGRHLGTFNAEGYFRTVDGRAIEELTGIEPEGADDSPDEGGFTGAVSALAIPEDGGPRNWRRPARSDEDRDGPDDIDLLRWSLDEGSSPFADLLQELDGKLVARPGVTAAQLRERQRRVLDVLRNHVASTDEGSNQLARAIERYSKLAA